MGHQRPKKYKINTYNYAGKKNHHDLHKNTRFCLGPNGKLSASTSFVATTFRTKGLGKPRRDGEQDGLDTTESYLTDESPSDIERGSEDGDESLLEAAYIEYMETVEVKPCKKRQRAPGVSFILRPD